MAIMKLSLSQFLDQNEATMALKEVHARLFGAHMSGIVLAKKILQDGYYWPTLEHDACKFAKWCLPYQQHANLI